MTDPADSPDPVAVPAVPESAPDDARAERRVQLKTAGLVVIALAVLGAILGIVWEAWSPPGPFGVVLPAGIEADETEAFVAGDGRFALMTVIVGVLAAVVTWFFRRARGPLLALALAVGGAGGAALTDLVGWAVRGDGHRYACGDGTTTCIDHLPLTVHMHSLWFAEAAAALLVYSLFVAFAVSDDLGRPDHAHAARQAARSVPTPPITAQAGTLDPVTMPSVPTPSLGTQGDPQDPWGHRNAPGPA